MTRPLVFVACLLFTGCAGYHLGPAGKLDYQSVAVPMFRNKTLQPQLEAQVTNAIIKRIQSDGQLRVNSRADAEVLVTGDIIRYHRTPLRFQRDDATVPREYRVTITAQIEVRDQRTGQVIVKSMEVEGRADTFIGTDLQSADYQALPLVADDLARRVVSLLVDKW